MFTYIVFLGQFFFSGFLRIGICPCTFAAACFQIDPISQQKVQKKDRYMGVTVPKNLIRAKNGNTQQMTLILNSFPIA